MAGVVLHAIAVPHLPQHLQVVLGTLLQPLSLQQLALGIQKIQPLVELRANRLHRRVQAIFGGHKVFGRIDVDRLQALKNLPGGGVHIADRLHLIAKQFHPHQPVFIGGADFQHIALHAEATAGNFCVVAAVLVIDQLPQLTADVQRLAHLKLHRSLEVFTRYSQTVDAADGGHHDHIAPFKQRPRCRVAQHVDLFID